VSKALEAALGAAEVRSPNPAREARVARKALQQKRAKYESMLKHAEEDLDHWLGKLSFANTYVTKLRRQVKYYKKVLRT